MGHPALITASQLLTVPGKGEGTQGRGAREEQGEGTQGEGTQEEQGEKGEGNQGEGPGRNTREEQGEGDWYMVYRFDYQTYYAINDCTSCAFLTQAHECTHPEAQRTSSSRSRLVFGTSWRRPLRLMQSPGRLGR